MGDKGLFTKELEDLLVNKQFGQALPLWLIYYLYLQSCLSRAFAQRYPHDIASWDGPSRYFGARGLLQLDRLSKLFIHCTQDPRDVVIFHSKFHNSDIKSLADLPAGSVIGTSSQRRIVRKSSFSKIKF